MTETKFIREGSSLYSPRTRLTSFTCAGDVVNCVERFFDGLEREMFAVAMVDSRNQLRRLHVVSIGSMNASIVHSREVFRPAIKHGAVSILLLHNHPSGDPTPSPDDIALTKRMREVGEVVGIEVLDHIILGGSGRYCSLKSRGYMR